jgi:hypothetical protein
MDLSHRSRTYTNTHIEKTAPFLSEISKIKLTPDS